MLRVGTQSSLARVSSASATQVRAWAAATTSGRASASFIAAARLIGNRRSPGANGAGLSVGRVASGEGSAGSGTRDPASGTGGCEAGSRSLLSETVVGVANDTVVGRPGWLVRSPAAGGDVEGRVSRPLSFANRSI